MNKIQEEDQLQQLLDVIIEAIRSKKGEEITDLDLTHLNTSICRHFVICHASSTTQVKAIAHTIEDQVSKKNRLKPFHREGYENASWILLDFADVIVHVFQETYRRFYQLEELWADGIRKDCVT